MYALAETHVVCDVITASLFLSCQVYIQSIIHIRKKDLLKFVFVYIYIYIYIFWAVVVH